jgi:hypothetical protein
MALNLKGEEMPTTFAMMLEGADSGSDAAACPTTTNNLDPATNLMINTG